MLNGKTIVLGISACSPATKAIDLIKDLRKRRAEVHVILTPNAAHFVSPLLLQREAGTPLQIEQFELPKAFDQNHQSLSVAADLILLAPVSANTLGKAANGIADNLLTTTILSSKAQIMAAMHINPTMFGKASVQRNIRQLKEDGFLFVGNENNERPSMFPSLSQIFISVESFFHK